MTTEEPTVLGRLGRVLYWIATTIAVVLALVGVGGLFFSDKPVVMILVVAGLTWLAGRTVLYILSGR